ncbi:MAG: sigma-70 family RNA polymerase sigma factor [Prolixibacteraceae bacterium]
MVNIDTDSHNPNEKINVSFAKLLKNGDSRALKVFFNDFYPSVCIFACNYVKRNDVAEDIAQDAFLRYWDLKENFSEVQSIKAFIYNTTRNACLNHLQQIKTREEILKTRLQSEELAYEFILEEEAYRILHAAIEGLPLRTKQIMIMILKGNKNNEIADKLEISVNTVKTLKKNAYVQLRLKLQGQLLMLLIIGKILCNK